jgi:hypothetical protein
MSVDRRDPGIFIRYSPDERQTTPTIDDFQLGR